MMKLTKVEVDAITKAANGTRLADIHRNASEIIRKGVRKILYGRQTRFDMDEYCEMGTLKWIRKYKVEILAEMSNYQIAYYEAIKVFWELREGAK